MFFDDFRDGLNALLSSDLFRAVNQGFLQSIKCVSDWFRPFGKPLETTHVPSGGVLAEHLPNR
jgi:hypothetical protein